MLAYFFSLLFGRQGFEIAHSPRRLLELEERVCETGLEMTGLEMTGTACEFDFQGDLINAGMEIHGALLLFEYCLRMTHTHRMKMETCLAEKQDTGDAIIFICSISMLQYHTDCQCLHCIY